MTSNRDRSVGNTAPRLWCVALVIAIIVVVFLGFYGGPAWGGVLPPGAAFVCVVSVLLGYLFRRLRSRSLGLGLAVIMPVLVSYILAWVLMSPLLHPGGEGPGGWDIVATLVWAIWAVPVCISSYVFFRWRYPSSETRFNQRLERP